MSIEWRLFDPDGGYDETYRNLPHRDQSGALTFVTLRLADSMPKSVVARWHSEIEHWLQENGLGGKSVEDVLNRPSIDLSLKNELRRFKHRRWHGHLDDCHGACELRDAGCRKEVYESLLNFDGERYDVERFVIMPNHVHALIQTRNGFGLRKQFREIQRYSARRINRLIGRTGDLWQGEPFDHIVRSASQFSYLQNYIFQNPNKAQLAVHDYSIYVQSGSVVPTEKMK